MIGISGQEGPFLIFRFLFNSCNRFSFRKAEFYNKADDESSNKKHFDLYYILISQKLSFESFCEIKI